MDHLTNAPHGRSAASRTKPRNRCLSGAELQVRIQMGLPTIVASEKSSGR